jgi:AraC-like DNA-binding protein
MDSTMLDERKLQFEITMANYIDVAPGYCWGPRTVGNPELIYIVSGKFMYTWDEGFFEAGAGHVLFIPVELQHTLKSSSEPGCISCIHFDSFADGQIDFHVFERLSFEVMRCVDAGKNSIVHDLFAKCADEFNRISPYREYLCNTVFSELWLRLCELWRLPLSRKISRRVRRMADYLDHNYQKNISRSDIGKHFGLSPEYVNTLFKKELGITPTEYLHRRRIYTAYNLIVLQNYSVKEAAEEVGFCDQFYFSRIFKRITGKTPSSLK